MQNKFPIIKFNCPEGVGSKRLFITIETERLMIQTVTMDDAPAYQKLFEDPDVMNKYASGKPVDDPNYAVNRIKGWIDRWGNNDPFNGMAVFLKESKEFVGHAVIGRSGANSISELAYLFNSKFWHKDYGSEAVVALVNHLVPEIIKRNMLLDGVELSSIEATTRTDPKYLKRFCVKSVWKQMELLIKSLVQNVLSIESASRNYLKSLVK